MFTQCPECMTVFTVDAQSLARAHGTVSCSQCGATFGSLATLCDRLPTEAFETLPINEPAAAPPLLLQAVEHEPPAQQNLFAGHDGDAADDHAAQDDPLAAPIDHDDAPDFFARPAGRSRPGSRRLVAACLVLCLTLAGQLAWAERATLVENPTTAGWWQSACAWLGCTLPKARDLAQLELTSRDVRRHPSVPDALMISATIHNQADFRQPWPVISIRLSDLHNRPVAMRRFRPADYLHDPAIRQRGLPPGATAALVFEVVDPGQDAIAFQFMFM